MKISRTKLITASVLVVLGASAHAEGFSFYGLVDGGLANTSFSKGGSSKTEFVTGGYAPTFLGMTAEKKLDAGLTGGLKFEQGFLLTGKTYFDEVGAFADRGGLFNREANAYIKGDFGKFTLGTQGNIAFGTGVLTGEPRLSNYGSSLAAIALMGGLGTVDYGAVSYVSPSSSGVTFGAAFAPRSGGTTTSSEGAEGKRLTLSYAGSSMGAGLAYYSNKPVTGSTASGTVASGFYKVDALTLKVILAQQKNPAATLNSLGTLGAGGSYALTAATSLDFGVYQSKDSAAGYETFTTGLGVQHKFLKDLTVYAQYASVQNKGTFGAAYNYAGPSSASVVQSLTAGQSANTVNVGLLYAFF